MADKNKIPKKKESKIEIQTRTPARPGIFDRIGTNRSNDRHPLKDILNFPVQSELTPDLPSTEFTESRPQNKIVDGNSSKLLPSTDKSSERPQIEQSPSTLSNVDVLPSTQSVLPSTNSIDNKENAGKTSTLENLAVHSNEKLPSTKTDRHSKFLARYDNRISPVIKQQIDVFCAKFDLSQREFAEQCAVHFIEMWTAKFEKNVDGKTAHDDRGKMIMYKSKVNLINLYRLYNAENKWKFKDDEVGLKYADLDLRIIELGIIETQFNSNFKKINSFSYYQNEIENFTAQKLSEEMISFLMTHYRKKWTTATGRKLDYSILEKNS